FPSTTLFRSRDAPRLARVRADAARRPGPDPRRHRPLGRRGRPSPGDRHLRLASSRSRARERGGCADPLGTAVSRAGDARGVGARRASGLASASAGQARVPIGNGGHSGQGPGEWVASPLREPGWGVTGMAKARAAMRTTRPPSLVDALVPLIALAVLLGGSLAIFGLDALDGPIQVALILCAMIAAMVAVKNGHPWSSVQEAGQEALSSITSAIFILLAVGALIGTWNLAGTIPTLVYYGIQVLQPSWYYAAAALICGLIALSIGSSWTTTATIGVGLVGIALMLGVSPAITAGAVISGAYLGDTLSR